MATEVKGYAPLSDAQKELANEGKILEERVMRWLDRAAGMIDPGGGQDAPIAHLTLGRRSIQQGFMWAVRSIFRPQRIALPEDTP